MRPMLSYQGKQKQGMSLHVGEFVFILFLFLVMDWHSAIYIFFSPGKTNQPILVANCSSTSDIIVLSVSMSIPNENTKKKIHKHSNYSPRKICF